MSAKKRARVKRRRVWWMIVSNRGLPVGTAPRSTEEEARMAMRDDWGESVIRLVEAPVKRRAKKEKHDG